MSALSLWLAWPTVISTATPTFSSFQNTSACHGLDHEGGKLPWGTSSGDLKYLGVTSTLEACNAAAAVWKNASASAERCLSTCWYRAAWNQSVTNQCFCNAAPVWMPLPSPEADSAVVNWPCTGPDDCSYNGVCGADGACKCQPAWGGVRCGELQLLPVDSKAMGFREVGADDSNVSTWGAPVLYDEASDKWHAWASEMMHGCGINAWETNSQIVHLTADQPSGPFKRTGVFAPPFAHEPDVVRDPGSGRWVMTYSAFNSVSKAVAGRGYDESTLAAVVCTNCSNGASPPQGSPGCPFQRGRPANLSHAMIQMMAIADSPEGPWQQLELHGLTAGWDWNTALTINTDGSAVALIRGGMTWHAGNYSDNTTWHAVGTNASGTPGPEGPQWAGGGVEDPYIYRDGDGIYHALAHAFTPFYGVHAFVHPHDVPANWSDPNVPLRWTLSGAAYDNNVQFKNRGSFAFSRRERPHLIWKEGESAANGTTPVALSNGVEYGKEANTAGEDTIFTLVQLLQQ
jgi:hypothetical protein